MAVDLERYLYDLICREIVHQYHLAFEAFIEEKIGRKIPEKTARMHFAKAEGMKRIIGRIHGFGVVKEINQFLEEELSLFTNRTGSVRFPGFRTNHAPQHRQGSC